MRNCGKFQYINILYMYIYRCFLWSDIANIITVGCTMCPWFTLRRVFDIPEAVSPMCKNGNQSPEKTPIRKKLRKTLRKKHENTSLLTCTSFRYTVEDTICQSALFLCASRFHCDRSCTPRFWNGSSETYSNGTLAAFSRVAACHHSGDPGHSLIKILQSVNSNMVCWKIHRFLNDDCSI